MFRLDRSYKLVVPKNTTSPTDSIYKVYDIVAQSRVIHSTTGSRTVYSSAPFTLRYKMPNGKVIVRKAQLNKAAFRMSKQQAHKVLKQATVKE